MTDRPILFSGPMVLALLAGRKTQTRRVIKPQPDFYAPGFNVTCLGGGTYPYRWLTSKHGPTVYATDPRDLARRVAPRCRVQPGDLLWVREAWRAEQCFDDRAPSNLPNGEIVARRYEADGAKKYWKYDHLPAGRPRASMHMPRWASRLTLEVTDVRVERVQDISEADARAEGVLWVPGHGEITTDDLMADPGYSNFLHCREGYQYLWNSLNAERGYGWDENPWVSVTTFNVHKSNIDVVKERT